MTSAHRRQKQDWTAGNYVNVGFLQLQVLAKVPTPGDFRPDQYLLRSADRFYAFTPHFGLERITEREAAEMYGPMNRRLAA